MNGTANIATMLAGKHFSSKGSLMNRRVLYAAIISLFPGIAAAADYAGNYSGSGLTVVISADGSAYGGEIRKGEQTFTLTAHEQANQLSGVFTSGGNPFNFTATQQGDDLILVTGGNTFQLHRNINPLAAAPAAAAPPSTQSADALAKYTIINSSDVGRSLLREIPDVKTTTAALRIAFPDLANYFGARPTILGGYEDQRDHKSAFVSFSAQLNGQALKGFVTTKLRDDGAVVFIVFGRENATKAEWAQLTAKPAVSSATAGGSENGGEPDLQTQMAQVPLKPYTFPDGTGAVGLAEGWTTNAQTESNLLITGPADQRVRMAFGGMLYTPDSFMVRQNQQTGGQQNLPIAPYNPDPATTLANIIRANSLVSQRKGGPTFSPERLINSKTIPARNPGGRAAQITYDLAMSQQGNVKHYRVFIQFEFSPVVSGSWGYYISLQLFAPPETFKQDYPVMMAQAFSLSENAAVVAAKGQRERDAAAKLAAAQQAAAAKVAQAHYDQTKSIEENEQIKMRSLTDFDEVIRGERTIEDTQTGEQTSVNLADVHNIVDNLNYNDPDRYKEIPLRDQFFPLPGHENDPDYLSR
jgi:nucleoid DNA-binding protein